MAGAAVSNRYLIDVVLLGCEQEADEVGLIKHGVRHRCGVEGLLSNEELEVLETEGVLGGVVTALAVSDWLEEGKKGDPGKIDDGDISCGGSLGGCVQGLDNSGRKGPYSCWRIILLLIGRQLVFHPKFELPHAVVSCVVCPHGCKDLTD